MRSSRFRDKPEDNSFKSFICALLVFLCACLIIYSSIALIPRAYLGGENAGYHGRQKSPKFSNKTATSVTTTPTTTIKKTSALVQNVTATSTTSIPIVTMKGKTNSVTTTPSVAGKIINTFTNMTSSTIGIFVTTFTTSPLTTTEERTSATTNLLVTTEKSVTPTLEQSTTTEDNTTSIAISPSVVTTIPAFIQNVTTTSTTKDTTTSSNTIPSTTAHIIVASINTIGTTGETLTPNTVPSTSTEDTTSPDITTSVTPNVTATSTKITATTNKTSALIQNVTTTSTTSIYSIITGGTTTTSTTSHVTTTEDTTTSASTIPSTTGHVASTNTFSTTEETLSSNTVPSISAEDTTTSLAITPSIIPNVTASSTKTTATTNNTTSIHLIITGGTSSTTTPVITTEDTTTSTSPSITGHVIVASTDTFSTTEETLTPTTISSTSSTEETTSRTIIPSITPNITATTSSVLANGPTVPTTTTSSLPLEVCTSRVCTHQGLKIRYRMEPYEDPEKNFYKYVCGGQEVNPPPPYNDLMLLKYINSNNPNFKAYKSFYNLCSKYEDYPDHIDRLEFVLKLVNKSQDLTEMLAELILTQSFPLFDVRLSYKGKNDYILKITKNGAGLRSTIANWDVQEACSKNCVRVQKVMYQDIIIDHDRISGYIEECRKKCVGAELQKFLKDINGTLTFDQNVIDRILEFMTDVMEEKPDEKIQNTSPNDLQQLVPLKGIEWEKLFELLTGESVHKLIRVENFEYIQHVANKLSKFDEEHLKVMLALLHGLSFYQNTVREEGNEGRELFCVDLMKQLMPDITNFLYKNDTEMKLENWRKEYYNEIKTNITKYKKALAVDKIELIVEDEEDLDEFKDKLDKSYANVDFDNYQDGLYKLLKHYRKSIYKLSLSARENTHVFRYFIDSYEKYPRSLPDSMSVALPFGMFHTFSRDLPYNMYNSKVGMRIVKELLKHVDDKLLKPSHDDQFLAVFQFENVYISDGVKDMLAKLSEKYRYVQLNAFDIIYPTTTCTKTLPFLSECNGNEVLLISALQEYCTKEVDDILNLFQLNIDEPLPAEVTVNYLYQNFVRDKHINFSCFK